MLRAERQARHRLLGDYSPRSMSATDKRSGRRRQEIVRRNCAQAVESAPADSTARKNPKGVRFAAGKPTNCTSGVAAPGVESAPADSTARQNPKGVRFAAGKATDCTSGVAALAVESAPADSTARKDPKGVSSRPARPRIARRRGGASGGIRSRGLHRAQKPKGVRFAAGKATDCTSGVAAHAVDPLPIKPVVARGPTRSRGRRTRRCRRS